MARLRNANCPSCAGDLQVDAQSDRVKCRYCGTTSFIAGRGKAPPDARLIHVHMPRGLVLALWFGSAALLVTGIVIAAALSSGEPRASLPLTPQTPSVPAPAIQTPPPAPPPELPVLRARTESATLLADVDHDGHAELLAPITVSLAGKTTQHYAFFESRSLRELARTPALPDLRRDLVGAIGNRLLIAYHDGQLTAFDLTSGNEQWSTALGERVLALRVAKSTDSAHVTTDAQRKLLIDLTTGRQSETRDAGGAVLASADSQSDPRDRRDHQAPEGIEAYRCGGVRVMGSANYSVPDACQARAHIDTDRLPGMVGHRLWKDGSAWLVFGVRAPGAFVPMVGRLARGAFAWKSEVPVSDPLAAREGGPRFVALAAGRLFLGYETGRESAWFVTAFDVVQGTRLWTSPLPTPRGSLQALLAQSDRVFVLTGDALMAFEAGTGQRVGRLGPP
jgi:hypothetical protein